MNYQQAKARLEHPRSKASKVIGHKLTLRYVGDLNEENPPIALRYFNTDILVYFPDGGVRTDSAGWMSSPCTRRKIEEYLPHGWKLRVHSLHYSKQSVATIHILDDKWDLLGCYPWLDNTKIYKNGRPDYTELNKHHACDLVQDVVKFTHRTVEDFLSGKLPRPGIPANVKYGELFNDELMAQDLFKEPYSPGEADLDVITALEFIRGQRRPEAFLEAFSTSKLRLYYRTRMPPYWSENYPFTTKPKTLKQEVARLEYLMKGGCPDLRHPKNSGEYYDYRGCLRMEIEEVLLTLLGFRVFS